MISSDHSKYIIIAHDLFMIKGGVSDYTNNLANQLHKKDRLEYVLTPYGRKGESDYDIRQLDVQVYRSSSSLDKWKITSKVFTLFHYLNFYLNAYLQLVSIKKSGATVIFTDYYLDKFDIIIFLVRILGIKYIIVFHGLDIMFGKSKRFVHLESNIKGAEFLVFNSQATNELFNKTFSMPGIRSVILYPGIDIASVEKNYLNGNINNSIYRSSTDQVIFSTVSNLGKRKGVDKAIQIVSKLHKKHPAIKYYIAGTGAERENLGKLVSDLNAGGFIHFLESIDHQSKFQLLSASDVFILPNYSVNNSDFEGFGISFIEASLCGNLVIGGNHGGAKEAVKNKTTGYLFDFDKEQSIDECVELLDNCINNKKQVDAIKQEGEKYVRQSYDWNNLIDNFLSYHKS